MGSISDEFRQTQLILNAAGPCPESSSLDLAPAKTAEIESSLKHNLEEHDAAEKEKHQSCENQSRDLQGSLIGVYMSSAEELTTEMNDTEDDGEVVRILKEAESGVIGKVELSGRQLRIFPEELWKIQGLRVLNISQNQLQMIPDAIAALRKLEELHVSSNLLEYLPDSIGLLPNLKILNVSANKLKELPETIAHCSSLLELDASFNKLTCLPTNLGYGLVNLEKLLIHLNKIRYFPASLSEMKSLRYLDAHFNELSCIPSSIGRLKNLQVLNLSNNFRNLTCLPLSIGDLSNLNELDLSNNQIQALPDSFCQLEKLVKLNLEQNPLVIPPTDVVSIGIEAVMEFMREGNARSQEVKDENSQRGWLGWRSSIFTSLVSGISQSVGGYIGSGKSEEDPWFDQRL